ncbi:serine/threonine-protein kinase Nek8 [Phlebotomus argentipes]|uniref:serine/threonine-protein kinase Nek8 n=1 Tax=Phlebotomus argentipes TaxID=94469 RepID=UPI002892E370|nr:serine/threonine-protein kinase Nek8 [Phlebotomus argentipes]
MSQSREVSKVGAFSKASSDLSNLSTLSRFRDPGVPATMTSTSDEVILPEFERLKVVGRGSFGIAVLYRKRSDQTLVVLKQVKLSELTPDERAMAMNEVEVFSKLHHPNVISYLGSFLRGDLLLIEMEYAEGGTLAHVISARTPTDRLPERQILTIVEQITSAVAYLHAQAILHRDLKTANVFLSRRGVAKIGDFGISKIMHTKIDTRTILGTPYYFSPEMCEGRDYDAKSDVWALGCILGEMCCLKKAFSASNLSQLVAKIMAGQYLPPPAGYSTCLRNLLKLLLQVNPADRPAATEVLQYWIPLVYRHLGPQRGYTYPRQVEEEAAAALEQLSLKQYTEEVTAGLPEPLSERSVLYQLHSFGTGVSMRALPLPATAKIARVATNGAHFVAVMTDGVVYTWGDDGKGQLALGASSGAEGSAFKHYPSKVESLKGYTIVGASCGDQFTIFWTNTGVVLSCGENSSGALGHGDRLSRSRPLTIERLRGLKVIEVACGGHHVAALTSTGIIFTWGSSQSGALGLGTSISSVTVPTQVDSVGTGDTRVAAIYAGINCTLALLDTGEIYASGANTKNRLGFGKSVRKIPKFRKINQIAKKVTDLSIAEEHSAFILEGGYVITFGDNFYGQRGLGHNKCPPDVANLVTGIKSKFIIKVRCNSTGSIVFSDDNVVSFWGTRFGVPTDNFPDTLATDSDYRMGGNTAAFTNFLVTVYKSELILDPIDILALYSSPEQLSKGHYVKISDILPLQHSTLILVNTTNPLISSPDVN